MLKIGISKNNQVYNLKLLVIFRVVRFGRDGWSLKVSGHSLISQVVLRFGSGAFTDASVTIITDASESIMLLSDE